MKIHLKNMDAKKLLRNKKVIEEINRHKWLESEITGYDIGFEAAKGLYSRGVLVAGTLFNARVIRIEPPLAIPLDDVNRVLEILHETLVEVQTGSKHGILACKSQKACPE